VSSKPKTESREYLWRFAHGKLCELNITQRGWLNTAREMALLIEKYGQPSESKTAEFQNAFGAKWECLEVFWNMPDGTLISAREYIDTDYRGAPERKIMIAFQSKDAIAEAQRKAQPKSNPYPSRLISLSSGERTCTTEFMRFLVTTRTSEALSEEARADKGNYVHRPRPELALLSGRSVWRQ
jgi:hypothetical protein